MKTQSVDPKPSTSENLKMSQRSAWSSCSSKRDTKQHSPSNNNWPPSFGKCDTFGKGRHLEAHSNQNKASSLKFSGMNPGCVMKMIINEEMRNLKMTKDVPLDLSRKSWNHTKKNDFSVPFKRRSE